MSAQRRRRAVAFLSCSASSLPTHQSLPVCAVNILKSIYLCNKPEQAHTGKLNVIFSFLKINARSISSNKPNSVFN